MESLCDSCEWAVCYPDCASKNSKFLYDNHGDFIIVKCDNYKTNEEDYESGWGKIQ